MTAGDSNLLNGNVLYAMWIWRQRNKLKTLTVFLKVPINYFLKNIKMTFIPLNIPSWASHVRWGKNEGDYWQRDEFSLSLQWTYHGLTSPLQPTKRLLSFFFAPKRACSIPQGPCDAWGCGETRMNTGSIQSLHQCSPPLCLWWDELDTLRLLFPFHGDIDLICSELSIPECLKGLEKAEWHESQVPWKDMTLILF